MSPDEKALERWIEDTVLRYGVATAGAWARELKPYRTRKCFRCGRHLADEEGIELGDATTSRTVFCHPLCRATPFECPQHGGTGVWAGEGGPFCGLCEKHVKSEALDDAFASDALGLGSEYWTQTHEEGD